MAFTLDQVVPWGRSFDEYVAMFDLRPADLSGRILGCADGPAGFNAEAARRGLRVVSCDPLYAFSAQEISRRIAETFDRVMAQLRANQADYEWSAIATPEDCGRLRMAAMRRFLEDYAAGRQEGRYVVAELPSLPFADNAFDLALCSHFLFLYSAQMPPEFHIASVAELCRVAREVRLFPLLDLGGRPSPDVPRVIEFCRAAGRCAEILPVPYEFQRGGNAMLRIAPRAPDAVD